MRPLDFSESCFVHLTVKTKCSQFIKEKEQLLLEKMILKMMGGFDC